MEKVKKRQALLSVLWDGENRSYYEGDVDGIDGPATQAAAERFTKDYGLLPERVLDSDTERQPQTAPEAGSSVMVFSKAADGNTYLTKNFRVKEFACQDGSDPIFIHPMVPRWCQLARDKFGYPFTPNSAYRTVSHNAKPSVGGAARSNHLYGLAVDIPEGPGATPQQLYDFFDELLGDSGELGIYSWGVHVAVSKTKSRFRG